MQYIPISAGPVLLYADIDLTGRAVALTPSSNASWLNNFTTFGFNDTVTSIKTFSEYWTVYSDANQSGNAHALNPNRWMRNWTYWGGNNDEISSIAYNAYGAGF